MEVVFLSYNLIIFGYFMIGLILIFLKKQKKGIWEKIYLEKEGAQSIESNIKAETENRLSYKDITIIIGFHNEEKKLPFLLDSILKYIPNEVKIIFVDDRSSDNSYNIVEEFCKKRKNTTLLKKEKIINKDLSPRQDNIQYALNYIQTPYFIVLDADVIITEYYLDNILTFKKQKFFGYGTTFIHIENPKSIIEYIEYSELFFLFINSLIFYLFKLPGSCMGNNLIINTKKFKQINGYKNIGKYIVDDMALYHYVYKNFSHKEIEFIPKAKLYTLSYKNLKDHIKQKKRWFFDSIRVSFKYYKLTFFASIFMFLVFFSIICNLIINPNPILHIFLFINSFLLIKTYTILFEEKQINTIKLSLIFFLEHYFWVILWIIY